MIPAPSSTVEPSDSVGTTAPSPRRPRTRDQSLNDVRAIIPQECYERPTGRALLAVAQATVLYLATVVALALTDIWWQVLALWLLAGFGVSGLFVLGHDASHGALTSSPRLNRWIARACMVPSAHVEPGWALGHNRVHHGYTTRQGFDFVWHPLTPLEYEDLGRLARVRHRIEWSWLGSGLYFGRAVWWDKMMRFVEPENRTTGIGREKRRLIGLWVLLLAAAAAFGAWRIGPIGLVWMPVKVLIVPLALFLQIIGWTVYVHHVDPSIRWWPKREWNQYRGQMESTTVLHIPAIVNRLWFHNIFIHVPHHVDVRIPFHQLPKAAAAIGAAYPDVVRDSKFRMRDYLRASRACKLYDFEAGRWLTYREARAVATEG